MIGKLLTYCIDINTEHCPCLLAETNHCVFCSHLKGDLNCNCNWTGTCIYYEKQWQSKVQSSAYQATRREVNAIPENIKELGPHTYYLELTITPQLAQDLDKAGSYVFLRKSGDPEYFSFPVGVMGVVNNNIQLVIEAVGPKSSRVLNETVQQITVRGPYRNGIFGQPWIDNTKSGRVVLVTGGMGQPPAMPVAKNLVKNGASVLAIIAPGKVGNSFITPWLQELGIAVFPVASLRHQGMSLLKEMLTSDYTCPELVVSAGPDEQHYGVISAMQAANVNLPMAATNNSTMCCGEGICGSCEKITHDNKKIKTCKVQTDFRQLICD